MGATTFVTNGFGPSAKAAFAQAKQYERDESGGDFGYSGTILEKDRFVVVNPPLGASPSAVNRFIEAWLDENDDKWGPAGCIDNGDETYTFFGWASE